MNTKVLGCTLALCFLFACDGGDKRAADADKAKAGDAKATKAGDTPKPDSGDKGDTKATPKVAEKHFDVTHDRSGVLARSAAVLAATETIDNADLRDLSHHAESLPSFDKVCTHIASIRGGDYDVAKCVKEWEHHVVRIGPELYGEVAACELEAKTVEELDACDAGEAEAEKLLHAKPHGEGVDAETCGKFFEQFEKLAIADAGDDRELVKTVLEEVKPDLLEACTDQGSKAEVECGLNAKTLHALQECASALL